MSGLLVVPRLTRQSPVLATFASAFGADELGAGAGDDGPPPGFPVGVRPSSRVRNTAAMPAPASASRTTTMITPIAVPDGPVRSGRSDGRGGPHTSPVTEPGAGAGRPPYRP